MIAWALTYLLHSTVLILAGWALARSPWGRGSRAADAIWKCALAGALLTATLQHATGASRSLPVSMPAQTIGASIGAGGPVPTGDRVPWIALMWAATAVMAAARLAHGWIRLRRQAGRRRVMATGPLRRELDALLRTAGVTRRVTLSCSRGLAVPRAVGMREICVPVRALRDLSPAEQRALLAHEVAHLLRRDGLWLFAAALLQALTWWQPLTRIAVARLRQSMELCCDDWAASHIPDPMALAECLVKVGEWSVTPAGFPVAAFAARGSVLRERVERLLDADLPARRATSRPWLAVCPLLTVLCLAPRVILAEPDIPRESVAPAVVRAVASSPAPERVTAAPAASRSRRPERGAEPKASRVPDVTVPSSVPAVAALAPGTGDDAASSPAAPEAGSIIMISEPLVRAPAAMRITDSARRIVPAPPATPQPLVGKADLGRIGFWLEGERRSLTFDPHKPKY